MFIQIIQKGAGQIFFSMLKSLYNMNFLLIFLYNETQTRKLTLRRKSSTQLNWQHKPFTTAIVHFQTALFQTGLNTLDFHTLTYFFFLEKCSISYSDFRDIPSYDNVNPSLSFSGIQFRRVSPLISQSTWIYEWCDGLTFVTHNEQFFNMDISHHVLFQDTSYTTVLTDGME